MVETMGFNNDGWYCIIAWKKDGLFKSKTVCYTPDDEKQALDRFNTSTDFYGSYFDEYEILPGWKQERVSA
ncbi:hypothetical protein [Bacillus sp. JJ722]|uniref:hypothetical protein n=1 Tax=Bacillus sp. JJ722 TaxID=3122973 RepID=UPI0030006556